MLKKPPKHTLDLLWRTACLFSALGLQTLLLPLRGQIEGFSITSLGLIGSAFSAGFTAGCLLGPKICSRVGHIRTFDLCCVVGAALFLCIGIFVHELSWIILRAFAGFSFGSSLVVIESLLNKEATNQNRGTILGIYTTVTHFSLMIGQVIITFLDVSNLTLFIFSATLLCISFVPAFFLEKRKIEIQEFHINLKRLRFCSMVPFTACFMIGLAGGSWGALGSVYGLLIGIPTSQIAWMTMIVLVTGGLMQIPTGRLSDLFDRRLLLAFIGFSGAIVSLFIFFATPRSLVCIFFMSSLYGAMTCTLYPLAAAHANDKMDPADYTTISGVLLFLYGAGMMIGPIISANLMKLTRPEGVFLVTAFSSTFLACHAALNFIRTRHKA